MRILIAHNHYQFPGGEDAVVKAEHDLLTGFGEDVFLYERSNADLEKYNIGKKIKYVADLSWSNETYQGIRSIIKKFRPDVAHFHNIFFMITPSAYFACKDERVPVVQSQHNFRLLCSNGLFFRNNRICDECIQKSLWHGVYHGCYRGSRWETAFIAEMILNQWESRTWLDLVDLYVMASEFTRQKYIQGGIPAEKIVVKPNFVFPDIGRKRNDEGYALYVGRLSEEKGVEILLEAWRSIKNIPLRIIGAGPLAGTLRAYAQKHKMWNVEFLGYVSEEKYDKNMSGAKFLIVPSICYENFPRIIAEVFSYGVPLLVSRLGSLVEIVEEGKTGLLFNPLDLADFIEKIRWMIEHEPALSLMSTEARRVFEQKYSGPQNHTRLISVYQKAREVLERQHSYPNSSRRSHTNELQQTSSYDTLS